LCTETRTPCFTEIRTWRARGRHACSWETICWVVVVSGCGEHHGAAGRRKIGAGAVVEDAAVAAAARSRASLDRAPDRTGCGATGRGMVTGIGWRGVGPLGRHFPTPRSYVHSTDLPRPGVAACCRVRRGPALGLPSSGTQKTECRRVHVHGARRFPCWRFVAGSPRAVCRIGLSWEPVVAYNLRQLPRFPSDRVSEHYAVVYSASVSSSACVHKAIETRCLADGENLAASRDWPIGRRRCRARRSRRAGREPPIRGPCSWRSR
jgi:hypothetical protein